MHQFFADIRFLLRSRAYKDGYAVGLSGKPSVRIPSHISGAEIEAWNNGYLRGYLNNTDRLMVKSLQQQTNPEKP
jgi:hypothetical protein